MLFAAPIVAIAVAGTVTAAASPAALAVPPLSNIDNLQDPVPAGDEVDQDQDQSPQNGRPYLMQINARVRYLSVPDSVISPWFFNSNDPGANPYDRPKVRALAIGGEYVFDLEPGNYVIYAEYIKSTMGEGYWDDVEEPANHDDGDWVRPDGLGGVTFGATYLHEVDAIPIGPGRGSVGLSFLFGAGLGVVVVTGGLEQWLPGSSQSVLSDCKPSSPAYDRVDVCASDGYKRIPKVLPMVDLSAGVRVNFANHFHIRIEGGLHDVLSLGTSMGVIF
ncbi:MAG: hypothetical protein GXP62_19285 [Oligoflexia bacterium]|nr:hypothetical protein [Oligoflexia bacterium]